MNRFKWGKTRFWVWICIWTLVISTVVPFDITYAQNIQTKKEVSIASYDESKPSEIQEVHEVVIFIRFADEPENIYETLGGFDYIKSLYTGPTDSLKAYIDEYSWGKVQVNTHFLPQVTNGIPTCYVDEHPASYYKKQTTSNPDGYTDANKGSRRKTLLQNALKFAGEDFVKKLGIEGEVCNLVFMVPDRGNWNDLLWSHKSTITVNGESKNYNMITYPKKSDISKTITHEFLHSLGFKDLYHLYNKSAPEPVGVWSIMGSTTVLSGHPFVHEKDRYGNWLDGGKGIKTIRKSGHYELGPSTANPKENTIAYKIPVEGVSNQFFMIEYRGSSASGSDVDLKKEGLVFYRVNTTKKGNSSGPPDEIFVLRNEGTKTVAASYFNGSEGKTEFSNFQLYNDTTNLGISVYNIKIEDGYMSFDITMPYTVMDGTSVLELKANGTSPQKVGTTIAFTATVEEEAISEKSKYEFTVEKDGKKEDITMVDNFTAIWTPTQAGCYTITYILTDAEGVVSSKKLEYLIGTETTAYILYNNSSWKQANIHYRIGTGTWTSLPGEKMISSNIKGYTWMYMIELGDKKKEAEVCFNNGNGSWDSRNEQNYTVGAGVYGIKNSTITKLEESLVITPIETILPMTTTTPTLNPTSKVTATPKVTLIPTKIPTETKQPIETIKPIETTKPVDTPFQAATITPMKTLIPIATPIPMVTKKPEETSVPKETEMAKATIVPTATTTPTPIQEKPMETIKPTEGIPTVEVLVTATPQVTKAPIDIEGSMQVGTEIVDNETKAVYKVTSVDVNKTVSYIKTQANEIKVSIPDTVNLNGTLYEVTSISENAFKNNKNIKTVEIGKNVAIVGTSAFQNCTALKSVKIGNSLETIGNKAFYGCKNLKEINLAGKLTNIGKYAFYKCSSLDNVTIPIKVNKIGTKAFFGCKKLKVIKIKTKKLTEKNVGSKAFKGIYGKAVIKVPKSKISVYKKILQTKGIVGKMKITKLNK